MSYSNGIDPKIAPWYVVQGDAAVAIEHPCLVKNVERAIDMLGGVQAVSQSLEHGVQEALSLSFKPQDPTSRTIISHHKKADNVLLQVVVPKRTGRKRKRGTSDAFVQDDATGVCRKDASYLLQSLSDNPENYTVNAMNTVQSLHVWRNMPDFVYSTSGIRMVDEIKSQLLPQQYPLLKEWTLPKTYGLQDTEALPPPIWSTASIPHTYVYRQNPAVKGSNDPVTGKRRLRNTQAPTKIFTYQMQWDDDPYPTGPAPECPTLDIYGETFGDLVKQLRVLFDDRPIWTRRALLNALPKDAAFFLVRHAMAHVAYSLRSGPWRDSYVRYGVDPRQSSQYRKFQTVLIQLMPKDKNARPEARSNFQRSWTRSEDLESHIFTGVKPVPHDGKVWQLCDLHDPQLKSLVDVPDEALRGKCELRYFGYYSNGTNAKIRIALKAKVDALSNGGPLPESKIAPFLGLPDKLAEGPKTNDPTHGFLGADATRQELEWASAYRSIVRTNPGEKPHAGACGVGRLSKSKPAFRSSLIETEEGTAVPPSTDAAGNTLLSGPGQPRDGSPSHEQETEGDDDEIAAAFGEPDEGEGETSDEEGDEGEAEGEEEGEEGEYDDDDDDEGGGEGLVE